VGVTQYLELKISIGTSCHRIFLTCKKRRGRDRQNTSKEISRPSISSGCGCRIWSISTDHVINGSHVDAVVGNANNRCKYHGPNPMDWRPCRSSCETDEAYRKARCSVQQPPKPPLVLCLFLIRLTFALFNVPLDDWDERKPCDEISNSNGDKS
jgi:hypothetical protein